MASLTVENLTKRFGGLTAVNNLDMAIEDGNFLVIVGPSGCGKSTTLNCIAGLEMPTEGRILLGDEDITQERPQDRNIAMVFQNYALYPHYSVRENIAFGLKMATDLPKDEVNQRVEDVAKMMEIEDLLNDKPKELSGGQQQRVALGRAIVREPALFLMDEPLSNLDAKLRSSMRTEIQQLQSELEITTVYVTHDQVEAMTMGDQIAIMDNGELQQIGSPLEVYYRPTNKFVAGFIGSPSMNFFDVDKRTTGSEVHLNHDQFTYILDEPGDAVREANSELVLGIRPQAFSVADGTERNIIEVKVDVIEPMGDENLAYFSFGDTTFTISLPPQNLPSEDEKIQLTCAQERIHLFNRRTTEAVKASEIISDTVPYSDTKSAA